MPPKGATATPAAPTRAASTTASLLTARGQSLTATACAAARWRGPTTSARCWGRGRRRRRCGRRATRPEDGAAPSSLPLLLPRFSLYRCGRRATRTRPTATRARPSTWCSTGPKRGSSTTTLAGAHRDASRTVAAPLTRAAPQLPIAHVPPSPFYSYGRHSSNPPELRFEGFGKHNGKDVEVVLKHSTTRGSDQFSTEDTGVTQDMVHALRDPRLGHAPNPTRSRPISPATTVDQVQLQCERREA